MTTNIFEEMIIITLLTTNWINDSITTTVKDGKQTASQHSEVTKHVFVETITLCTNRQLLSATSAGTNSEHRVIPWPMPLPTPSRIGRSGTNEVIFNHVIKE